MFPRCGCGSRHGPPSRQGKMSIPKQTLPTLIPSVHILKEPQSKVQVICFIPYETAFSGGCLIAMGERIPQLPNSDVPTIYKGISTIPFLTIIFSFLSSHYHWLAFKVSTLFPLFFSLKYLKILALRGYFIFMRLVVAVGRNTKSNRNSSSKASQQLVTQSILD